MLRNILRNQYSCRDLLRFDLDMLPVFVVLFIIIKLSSVPFNIGTDPSRDSEIIKINSRTSSDIGNSSFNELQLINNTNQKSKEHEPVSVTVRPISSSSKNYNVEEDSITGILNQYNERIVPRHVSRFNFAWRRPIRMKLPTLEESRNRILYSPIRSISGAGLGHVMATMNADISTAARFNLTYSHRIAKYGLLARPYREFFNGPEINRPYHHVGAVEQLFGWGVGEIPRDHIQNSICPFSLIRPSDFECMICNSSDLLKRKSEIRRDKNTNNSTPGYLNPYADEVVEIPPRLSYFYPNRPGSAQKEELTHFVNSNQKPNTVFTMPSQYCDKSPAYTITTLRQRSYFFHKYWDLHGNRSSFQSKNVYENESYVEFKERITIGKTIPSFGSRPTLSRLKEDRLNIAIHARRGDFFIVKRPMISVKAISSIVRQIVVEVVNMEPGIFSQIPISVSIYSEGPKLNSSSTLPGHDVSKMRQEFLDSDGMLFNESDIYNILINENMDHYGSIFRQGLAVNLRVAENTILSIHEMVAADIFIGSESGLSTHIVGSLSRAAFLLMPTANVDDFGRVMTFNPNTGEIPDIDISIMRVLWKRFSRANQGSLYRFMRGNL